MEDMSPVCGHKGVLGKNIPKESEDCEGQVALGRGITVLTCTRRVDPIAAFDYYLIDILQLTENQTLSNTQLYFQQMGGQHQRNIQTEQKSAL